MKEFVVKNSPKSPISETYRAIRTNLLYANVDQVLKTILMTSATAGEGKTTTLNNLAMTLCEVGHRVLVIDCDLRKPRIHKFFEISNAAGVTDILVSGDNYKSYVNKSIHERLHVLTAGKIPPSPTELLSSNAFKVLLEELEKDYDYVLMDTPPIVPVTDALILSRMVSGVILVVRSGKVEIEFAKRAKHNLEQVNAKVLGVVLNDVPVKGKRYQNYYYYAQDEAKEGTA